LNWLFDKLGDMEAKAPRAMVPRAYQDRAVKAVIEELGRSDSCFMVLCTGTGKTEVAIQLISTYATEGGVLFITPRIELTDQSADRFRSRGLECGVERAEFVSDERITVSCYDSLVRGGRYEKFLGSTKLVIVDESHKNFTPAALKMLGHLRDAGAKLVGMTATPRIGKKQRLDQFYGSLAFSYLYQDAVADGYLCEARAWLSVMEGLDLSKLPVSQGDYDKATLDRWMREDARIEQVVSLVEQTYDNKPSMVFGTKIAHIEELKLGFERRGIPAAIVHSELPPHERRQQLRDFEEGRCNVILNVEVLSVGWDFPPATKLYLARPTQSYDLYGQILGRAMRPLAGIVDGLRTAEERRAAIAASAKPWFEVYDLCDASRHNRLVTAADFLNPGMEPELQARVRKRQEKGGVNPKDIADEEQKALAAEKAALEMLERQQRPRHTGVGRYKLYERDILAPEERPDKPRRQWVMILGKKHRGWPLTKVPLDYLQWVLRDVRRTPGNASFMAAVHREVTKRTSA
jgi:superfamily II DNA or RNA helicase